MIINEKGLVRALKSAYKRGGYTILNTESRVIIYAEDWYITAEWEELPRKALATIVEHMGQLPAMAEVLIVSQAMGMQTAIPAAVSEDIRAWNDGVELEAVTMVPVTIRGMQLYQQEQNLHCYGVDPIALGVVDFSIDMTKDAAVIAGNRLMWEHEGEKVIVGALRPTETWPNAAERRVWEALEGVDLHKRDE